MRPDPPPDRGKLDWLIGKLQPIEGTPVETYLGTRGVCLPSDGHHLRYLPASPPKYAWPCMVGIVTDFADASRVLIAAFHRLRPDGNGKAPLRRTSNAPTGYPEEGRRVRLCDDADVTLRLGLAEGIETALSMPPLSTRLGPHRAGLERARCRQSRRAARRAGYRDAADLCRSRPGRGERRQRARATLARRWARGIHCPGIRRRLEPAGETMTQTHEPPPAEEIDRANRRAEYKPDSNGQAKSNGKLRFELIPVKDIRYDPKDDHWLVDGLLPMTGLAVVWGKYKSYKSFTSFDLAVAIADQQRKTWGDRALRHGPVVYVVAEDMTGIDARIEAYRREMPGFDELELYIVKARPNLGAVASDREALIESIREQLDGTVPVAIFLDTLARMLNGEGENDTGMQNFVNNAEYVAEAFQCLAVAVHHESAATEANPAADKPRGHTSLPGALVASLHVIKTGEGIEGPWTARRDRHRGQEQRHRLRAQSRHEAHRARREPARPHGDHPHARHRRIAHRHVRTTRKGRVAEPKPRPAALLLQLRQGRRARHRASPGARPQGALDRYRRCQQGA